MYPILPAARNENLKDKNHLILKWEDRYSYSNDVVNNSTKIATFPASRGGGYIYEEVSVKFHTH